ncbi:hypothetical protein CKK33_04945 [Mucilaginibacter sp. MD40]|uniref:hypothetical protein n=1 Tax=Mucilaginibacter sp. MD40 TaxID=2029590 RepID=UPI000BACC472|nr:hypothetical protein [Mucilaginibacter sp. MD40]PAW92870.1 hypothetical protein CKK33_04945 [Mucilaginibacter sp. MD40]
MMKMFTLQNISLFLIFMGGVGGILLSIAQTRGSAQDKADIIDTTKQENLRLRTQLTSVQNDNIQLNSNLSKSYKQIQEQQDALAKQTDQIIALNKDLSNQAKFITLNVTGGDGYPIVIPRELRDVGNGNSALAFDLHNKNKHPIFDLLVIITDYKKLSSKFYRRPNDNVDYVRNDDVRAAEVMRWMLPNMAKETVYPNSYVINDTDASYSIQIKTRNRTVIEKLILVKVKNEILSGLEIWDAEKGKIHQDLSPNLTKEEYKIIQKKLDDIPDQFSYTPTL